MATACTGKELDGEGLDKEVMHTAAKGGRPGFDSQALPQSNPFEFFYFLFFIFYIQDF